MKFSKWQGCGNDFVYIDGRNAKVDYGEFAKKYCDRHFGIGADGILALEDSDKADVRMRIINPDGSEPEMCGNGIRCFARALYDNGIVNKKEFTVETGAGVLVPKIVMKDGKVDGVTVDMGKPRLDAKEIPVKGFGEGRVISKPIEVAGKDYYITCVSMGNPHAVVFVEDAENCGIEKLGKLFESHSVFPNKTNTEFVQVLDREHIRMRVWERGAAITLACGTGACASLVASVLNDKTERRAKVILDGGTLDIEWAKDDRIYMTGPAELVFEGEI